MTDIWPWLTCFAIAAAWWNYRRVSVIRQAFENDLARIRADRNADDLEARRLAEAERARQARLFESLTEGVLVLDSVLRIQLSNKAFDRLFEVNHPSPMSGLMETVRSHQLLNFASQILETGRHGTTEIERNGTQSLFLQVTGARFDGNHGQESGVILVFHDLTRLRKLENTRKEFVANVSHELRSPLSLIKGAAETLLDGAKQDPATATRFLEMIARHTNRLTFLIEDLLTISALEEDRTPLNAHRMSILPVAQRVVTDLAAKAGSRGINLTIEIPSDLEAWHDGDRIQQVLFNLVDNAIRYGAQGGWVRIHAKRQEGDWLRIDVEDNGPGIPLESRERVFERFFRLDKARSRDHGGTGLGLSIVKHIVHAHGGQVWVEGQPGEGARFSFTLPLSQPPTKQTQT